eukprot:TRINITY_DN6590_c0_g1_i1.p1 TRINITY_DN6590_c0_g1~~TRINITY_DN6590_c0_g1_i1.p1  ORF type:complete len:203 (-),score=9.91 TRINITY_DN6590_c0_g1_i1:90-698(-)
MSLKLRKSSLAAVLGEARFDTRRREQISVATLNQSLYEFTTDYNLAYVVADPGSIRSLVAKLFRTRAAPNAKTIYVDENQIPAGIYFVHRESRHAVQAFLLETESLRTVDMDLRSFLCKSGELHLIITPLAPLVSRTKSDIKVAVTSGMLQHTKTAILLFPWDGKTSSLYMSGICTCWTSDGSANGHCRTDGICGVSRSPNS